MFQTLPFRTKRYYQDCEERPRVEVELEDTLEIVDELSVYAYDAYLIRCAIKYKSPLLTLDQGLARTAKEMNVKLQEVEQ